MKLYPITLDRRDQARLYLILETAQDIAKDLIVKHEEDQGEEDRKALSCLKQFADEVDLVKRYARSSPDQTRLGIPLESEQTIAMAFMITLATLATAQKKDSMFEEAASVVSELAERILPQIEYLAFADEVQAE